ncbi:translational activator of cytochrome c oxidase 1 [Aulostomus maculatus]
MAGLRALSILRPQSLVTAAGNLAVRLEPVCSWRPPVRTLQLCSALCAGHNKWSKVKNVKGPKDNARADYFSRLSKMIKLAVKEGGPNPQSNVKLAQLLEQARKKNMPKISQEAAIKGSETGKVPSQYLYEAQGPGGCKLLIEVLTTSNARSLVEVKIALNKNGGMLCDRVIHNFNKKGLVVVQGHNVSTEQALELAIEVGAEDVQESEDDEDGPVLQFISDLSDLKKVQASLAALGMDVKSAGLGFVPHIFSNLNQDQLDDASALIEALNDCPDVVQVWDNIQVCS